MERTDASPRSADFRRTHRPRPTTASGIFSRLAAMALLGAICFNASAASIPIPNADFSNAANEGTVGGDLIGIPGTSPIGSGPWSGAYFGALGLLAQPKLIIGQGKATIGDLLGVSAIGIVNNGGSFHQATSTPWLPKRRYTLSAEITVTGALNIDAVRAGNAGVALANGSTRLASSIDAAAVDLTLLSGSTYRLQLQYDTGASVTGNVSIQLLSEPRSVLTVNLLQSVKYDNVTLTTRLIDQVPKSVIAVDSTARSAQVGSAVEPPLAVCVRDGDGDPIAGVSVTFTTPSSGASATVTPNPAITDANGIAQVVVTANTIAGSYEIVAEVEGVSPPVIFPMTNLPGPASSVAGASGNAQSATVATAFDAPLAVQVSDAYGNGVPAVPVAFTAPTSGASATVPATPVATDARGKAQISPVANTVAGSYSIKATVAGVASSTSFDLANSAGAASAVSRFSGDGQTAEVDATFPAPLVVQVADTYGNAVAGAPVSFSAPATGASAAIPATPVATAADGTARITATANTVAGSYQVGAAVAGVASPASFTLANRAGPVTSIVASGGSQQSAVVLTPFPLPLTVLVSDNHGNPVGSVAVTFVAPASGASAGVTSTVTSGSDGRATTTAVANGTAGAYTVRAQASGSSIPFSLTNLLPPEVDPIGEGDPEQYGEINSVFSCVLLVKVSNGDAPQTGLEVEFTAPTTGPSATLSDGISDGSSVRVNTDEEGYAWVQATANGIPGDYIVRAQLLYSLAAPIEFAMHNLDANALVYINGFDGLCIPPLSARNAGSDQYEE